MRKIVYLTLIIIFYFFLPRFLYAEPVCGKTFCNPNCEENGGHCRDKTQTCCSMKGDAIKCEEETVQVCIGGGAVKKTPTPTKKAGKGTPTPTVNPLCVCSGANVCSPQCSFNKLTGVNYGAQVKCAPLPANRYSTAVTQANKNDWCRRPNRTKGDADGNDNVTFLDYFYLVSSQFGGKLPAKINADFNGDGLVNQADRQIIIKSIKVK